METKIKWTPYLACAYAEGFNEGENATKQEQLEAWAFIIKHDLWKGLQGFYGRTVQYFISEGIISKEGEILKDLE